MSIPIYRKIWEDTYGPIPVDESGKSYEIHHINGDHDDNRLENLSCISIDDHFDIHWSQGDIMAAYAISRRMNWRPDINDVQKKILSEQAKTAALKRVAEGTHNFLGGQLQKEHQARRKESGTHNFVNSNPNFENGEVMIICIDKLGNKKRIPKSQYDSQSGSREDWEYVFHRSTEATKRLFDKSKNASYN